MILKLRIMEENAFRQGIKRAGDYSLSPATVAHQVLQEEPGSPSGLNLPEMALAERNVPVNFILAPPQQPPA
jgi:hypothetical protein